MRQQGCRPGLLLTRGWPPDGVVRAGVGVPPVLHRGRGRGGRGAGRSTPDQPAPTPPLPSLTRAGAWLTLRLWGCWLVCHACQYVLARLEFDPMFVQFVPALRAFLDGPAKALVDDGLLAIEVREAGRKRPQPGGRRV